MTLNHPSPDASRIGTVVTPKKSWDILAAAAILLFAAAVRLIDIDWLPPGLFQDEAVNGVNVFTILAGHFQIYYGEREPLFMYAMALVSLALNPTPVALRVTAGLFSVVG
ncbi:MAG TPA: hypothetical protein VKT80_11715, partial [Chloroflexota bacterium]|nr:hypothetical protein [Chloroflexota bacterium]